MARMVFVEPFSAELGEVQRERAASRPASGAEHLSAASQGLRGGRKIRSIRTARPERPGAFGRFAELPHGAASHWWVWWIGGLVVWWFGGLVVRARFPIYPLQEAGVPIPTNCGLPECAEWLRKMWVSAAALVMSCIFGLDGKIEIADQHPNVPNPKSQPLAAFAEHFQVRGGGVPFRELLRTPQCLSLRAGRPWQRIDLLTFSAVGLPSVTVGSVIIFPIVPCCMWRPPKRDTPIYPDQVAFLDLCAALWVIFRDFTFKTRNGNQLRPSIGPMCLQVIGACEVKIVGSPPSHRKRGGLLFVCLFVCCLID